MHEDVFDCDMESSDMCGWKSSNKSSTVRNWARIQANEEIGVPVFEKPFVDHTYFSEVGHYAAIWKKHEESSVQDELVAHESFLLIADERHMTG